MQKLKHLLSQCLDKLAISYFLKLKRDPLLICQSFEM